MRVNKVILAILVMLASVVAMADGNEGGQVKPVAVRSMVMGPAVKGAPYSGEEVNTTDQVLGDGTHIHNETRTQVYRDSEGRVRRDSGDQIQILDPVAGISYVLMPKTMTAMKSNFATITIDKAKTTTDGDMAVTIRTDTAGESADPRIAKQLAEDAAKESMAATKMQMSQIVEGQYTMAMTYSAGVAAGKKAAAAKRESLGTQVIEGVVAEGSKTTNTLAAGSIGNDRDINIVSERWYSADLKTALVTSHSDPRSGTETFRLSNINRSEPDPALFQLPAGYKLLEGRRPAQ